MEDGENINDELVDNSPLLRIDEQENSTFAPVETVIQIYHDEADIERMIETEWDGHVEDRPQSWNELTIKVEVEPFKYNV